MRHRFRSLGLLYNIELEAIRKEFNKKYSTDLMVRCVVDYKGFMVYNETQPNLCELELTMQLEVAKCVIEHMCEEHLRIYRD